MSAQEGERKRGRKKGEGERKKEGWREGRRETGKEEFLFFPTLTYSLIHSFALTRISFSLSPSVLLLPRFLSSE